MKANFSIFFTEIDVLFEKKIELSTPLVKGDRFLVIGEDGLEVMEAVVNFSNRELVLKNDCLEDFVYFENITKTKENFVEIFKKNGWTIK